jgi:pheromone shutdown-related protein TraB
MHHYKNLTIIGTSHIAEKSVLEIERVFYALNPDIVAVELDRNRLEALLHKERPSYSPRLIGRIGVTGYVFAVLGSILQRKLGDLVGVSPGSDMLKACLLARDNQKKLALIDQDVQVTLKRLSGIFTFREKMRMLFDVFRSPFSKKLRINIKDVPEKELIAQLLKILKERYPGLYRAIIDERNQFMASKIAGILKNHADSSMLVVVGAGHEEELSALIKKRMEDIK